jgi:Flp pilus assembly pilin Flp
MRKTSTLLAKLWKDESGISSVEYALLLAFIGGGIVLAADTLSDAISGEMNSAAGCISGTDPNSAACQAL